MPSIVSVRNKVCDGQHFHSLLLLIFEPFERTRIGIGSPEEARRVVAELAKRELDFLKIRTVQNRDTYLALNQAAEEHGLKLVGHVTGIPPEIVLTSGQDGVEHGFYPPDRQKDDWGRTASIPGRK